MTDFTCDAKLICNRFTCQAEPLQNYANHVCFFATCTSHELDLFSTTSHANHFSDSRVTRHDQKSHFCDIHEKKRDL